MLRCPSRLFEIGIICSLLNFNIVSDRICKVNGLKIILPVWRQWIQLIDEYEIVDLLIIFSQLRFFLTASCKNRQNEQHDHYYDELSFYILFPSFVSYQYCVHDHTYRNDDCVGDDPDLKPVIMHCIAVIWIYVFLLEYL